MEHFGSVENFVNNVCKRKPPDSDIFPETLEERKYLNYENDNVALSSNGGKWSE